MRLLVVEDEQDLREQLGDRLRQEGFAVDAAADGRDGLHLGCEYPIDLAVVDIGLPDINGVELIRRLRAAERRFPVLILTARNSWQEKVQGLEAGADDYLTKPFHMEELIARVRALLRRAAGAADPVLRFGSVELDTSRQAVRVADRPLELTGFEYRILHYLVLHPGKVISKTELTEHIYEEDADRDSNVIEVLVGRLRRKLDPDGTLQPIETLRGRGYRFALDPV
ncbi:MAG: response regulator transcription factor [Gammaproteobacteria bacterium]|nr:response regulator transcription factor [Gammaproteobacteria bacterium]